MPLILIADDSATVRDLLVFFAQMHGLEVGCVAEDGAQAVDLASSEQPDVIIIDDDMPVMNGLAALPLLAAAAPGAVIVVYGASNDAHTVDAVLAAGAAAYFQRGTDSVSELFAFIVGRTQRPLAQASLES